MPPSEHEETQSDSDYSVAVAHGYLEEIESNNGDICKSSTGQGRKIGITSFKKVNSRGDEYVTNTYDRGAQEFILTTVLPQIAPVLLLDI